MRRGHGSSYAKENVRASAQRERCSCAMFLGEGDHGSTGAEGERRCLLRKGGWV
jgi:hypothetical protein